VSAFVLDLTERKRAEEKVREMTAQLDQVSRLGNLGEMAAKIAHELHQPLTAIYNYSRGAVRMIEAERLGLQEARALFEDLATQSMHAGQVVERVRSHVGKREPQFEPIELDSVIDDALILVRIAIREPDVELVVTRGSGVPRVRGDKIQLSQVVINLALNAVQALADVTDRPRRLTIETRACNDGGAEIVVADNGPGLAPIVRERLFRQFVTTKPMGLGLGLAMCKSIVELHGGELIARDPAGGGCAFHAVLPPLEPASDAEEDSASGGISGWSDDASVPENGGEFAEPEPLSDNAV
jgi:C4-dicarboxylate-specific signal transduction histidine kinase